MSHGKRKECFFKALFLTYKNYYENLPENWMICKLSEIACIKGGKRIPAGQKFSINATNHKYLRVTDMKSNTIVSCAYISDEIFNLIKNYYITSNDLYITVAGTIGSIGTIPQEYSYSNLTENADKIVLIDYINKYWLMFSLLATQIQNQIKESTTKVGQPKLSIKKIEELRIALPPYNEQKRIVNKINDCIYYLTFL